MRFCSTEASALNDKVIFFPTGNIQPKAPVLQVKSRAPKLTAKQKLEAARNRPLEPVKAAEALADPYMVKSVSDYLVSLDKPWAYRANAIWCLGVTMGVRASAMIRVGQHGQNSNYSCMDDDPCPLLISDVMESPTQFKSRITFYERKTDKTPTMNLVPFAQEALALYLQKCRPNFQMDEPLFLGGKRKKYPFTYDCVEESKFLKELKQVKEALGITTRFSTHTMRKSFAHYTALVALKLRMEGKIPMSRDILDIVNMSTCHYSLSMTQHYSGWDQQIADLVRLELSKFYENPAIAPEISNMARDLHLAEQIDRTFDF